MERPVLFNGAMMRKVLSGEKWQTRRMIKGDFKVVPHPSAPVLKIAVINGRGDHWMNCAPDHEAHVSNACPHGKVGDSLWVRETWAPMCRVADPHCACEGDEKAANHFTEYRADTGNAKPGRWPSGDSEAPPWRPSIHMPRALSRLSLPIVSVRVERLQDISEADAIAEGLAMLSKDGGRVWKYGIPDRDGLPGTDDDGWPWGQWSRDPRKAFEALWSSVYGAESWAASPWVWVIEWAPVGVAAKAAGEGR